MNYPFKFTLDRCQSSFLNTDTACCKNSMSRMPFWIIIRKACILLQTFLFSLTPHTVLTPSSSPWEQANTGQDKAQASGKDPTQRESGMSATEFARASLAWKTTKEERWSKKTYIAIPTVLYVVLNTDSASSAELLFYSSVSECGVLFTVWRQ